MNEEKYIKNDNTGAYGVAEFSRALRRMLIEAAMIMAVAFAWYSVGLQKQCGKSEGSAVETGSTDQSNNQEQNLVAPKSEPIRLRDAR